MRGSVLDCTLNGPLCHLRFSISASYFSLSCYGAGSADLTPISRKLDCFVFCGRAGVISTCRCKPHRSCDAYEWSCCTIESKSPKHTRRVVRQMWSVRTHSNTLRVFVHRTKTLVGTLPWGHSTFVQTTTFVENLNLENNSWTLIDMQMWQWNLLGSFQLATLRHVEHMLSNI